MRVKSNKVFTSRKSLPALRLIISNWLLTMGSNPAKRPESSSSMGPSIKVSGVRNS